MAICGRGRGATALTAVRLLAARQEVNYSPTVTTLEERLAVVEEQVRALRDDVARHNVAVIDRLDSGPSVPWEKSIRGRLHHLESESHASIAAARALAEAQRERRLAREERESDTRAATTLRVQLAALLVAACAIIAPYVVQFWP